jgi:hypothetical protein
MAKRKLANLSAELRELEILCLIIAIAMSDDSCSSDDEQDNAILLAMLYEEACRPRPPPTLLRRHIAQIDNFGTRDCVLKFRFKPTHLWHLFRLLNIPHPIKCGVPGHMHVFSAEEGFLLLLRRMAYPCRWGDLMHEFGLYEQEMSELFDFMVRFLLEQNGWLLRDTTIWLPYLPYFAGLITAKGAPSDLNTFAFIDGTLRPIARPARGQRSQYSGHKRRHGLKFQSVSLPNGMIALLHGPEDGRRHDITMLRNSGAMETLRELQVRSMIDHNRAFMVFGDVAYPTNDVIISGFKGADISEDEQSFNESMQPVRGSVEWCFGKIVTYFAFTDFQKNQKALLQPVSLYYQCAALLTNFHTCFYGSVTTSFFEADVPSLERYMRGMM